MKDKPKKVDGFTGAATTAGSFARKHQNKRSFDYALYDKDFQKEQAAHIRGKGDKEQAALFNMAVNQVRKQKGISGKGIVNDIVKEIDKSTGTKNKNYTEKGAKVLELGSKKKTPTKKK